MKKEEDRKLLAPNKSTLMLGSATKLIRIILSSLESQ